MKDPIKNQMTSNILFFLYIKLEYLKKTFRVWINDKTSDDFPYFLKGDEVH